MRNRIRGGYIIIIIIITTIIMMMIGDVFNDLKYKDNKINIDGIRTIVG